MSSGEGAAGWPLMGVGGGAARQLPLAQIQGPQRSGCSARGPLGEVLWGTGALCGTSSWWRCGV